MMNRHERRRAARQGTDQRKRVSDVALSLVGIDKVQEQLPDDRWYQVRVYIKRDGTVHFSQQIDPITGNPPL